MKLLLIMTLALTSCGDGGSKKGKDGSSCSVVAGEEGEEAGKVYVRCTDGTSAELRNGPPGPQGPPGTSGSDGGAVDSFITDTGFCSGGFNWSRGFYNQQVNIFEFYTGERFVSGSSDFFNQNGLRDPDFASTFGNTLNTDSFTFNIDRNADGQWDVSWTHRRSGQTGNLNCSEVQGFK